MAINIDKKDASETFQLIAKRSDGSIRQVLVQDAAGNIYANGFFPPGTMSDDPDWTEKRMYHWADAFSDEELLDPNNEFTITPEQLNTIRQEAIIANEKKEFNADGFVQYVRQE